MSHFAYQTSQLAIQRPVLMVVLNLLIMLAGLAALLGVEVRELPNIDRPVIMVRAVLDGASPQTMDAEVTRIIEGAVARVSGVSNIESSSEENNMRVRVTFSPDVDLNVAANDIREAVSRIQRQLPTAVQQLLVIKADANAQGIVQLAAWSNSLSRAELAERIEKQVVPGLLSINGVADVQLSGNEPQLLRVLLDPVRLAAYGLAVDEVMSALRSAQLDVPAGSYKTSAQDLIVRAYGSVLLPEQLMLLPLRDNIKLGDVAQVFYSSKPAESWVLLNGRAVVGLSIIRQAGANTISISDQVQRKLAQLNAASPELQLQSITDDALYIRGALNEVGLTLVLAVLIVLLVIVVFLGQWRASWIPAVTMPICLIGTLAAIWACGFSINLLTLLALVLATGLVVDDAIVVLENIQRLRQQGQAAKTAAILGCQQVFFAVLATTMALVAVFVPIAFLPGEAGRMFREFGLVLAIAVLISSVVALTLTPLMASRLPEQPAQPAAWYRLLAGIGSRMAALYFRSLHGVLRWRWFSLLLALALAAAAVWSAGGLKKELLPPEDRGLLLVSLTAPDGVSLDYSDQQARKAEAILAPYQQQGLIRDVYTIVGRGDKNRVFISATLLPWAERDISQQALADELNKKLRKIAGAQVRVIQAGGLNPRGGGGGAPAGGRNSVQLALLGNEYEEIADSAEQLAQQIKQLPGVDDASLQFDTSQPQLFFDINRQRAHELGVPLDRISQTLRVMVDRHELVTLSIRDQSVPLWLGPAQGKISAPDDLLNLYIRNQQQQLVPLSELVTVSERGVAAELDRVSQQRAVELEVNLASGVTQAELVPKIQQLAAKLPSGQSIQLLGEAATQQQSDRDLQLTLLLALLVIFLVLAAQFESFGSAVIVMFTVPFGLAAAVFALLVTNQSLNLYSQIGLVLLIGLMTKNAILLVEFMQQARSAGASIIEAIEQGVAVRLRPVMMTVSATILGALPLIITSGPGAEARAAIGWVIVAGLGLATVFTLYLTPLGYALLAPWFKVREELSDKSGA